MSAAEPPRFGRLVRALHALDFGWLLPALGRCPKPLGEVLSAARGRLRGAGQADWRSIALGHSHIGPRTLQALRELAPQASEAQRQAWLRERFAAEARDELEARWLVAGRCADLQCRFVGPGAALAGPPRAGGPGLVLVPTHYRSFILGLMFLARSGLRVNAVMSRVTHDPRVIRAVSAHFDAKYAGLQRHLNGGILVAIEDSLRPVYRMLERGEVLVVLGDAPVLPNGARIDLPFVGARRALAGGAVRVAQRVGADFGAFTCRRSGPRRYTLALSASGPARDEAVVEGAYRFLSDAILADPGGWWAADLLPDMPTVAECAPERTTGHAVA